VKLKTRLGLYVNEIRDRKYGDYYHVTANIVTIGLTAYERREIDSSETYRPKTTHDTIRNVNDHDDRADYNGLHLYDLQVQSQGCSDDETRHLYGFETEYRNVFSVDTRRAIAMAKTLQTIDKRQEKLNEQYGRPATFGAYLARIAQIIGADCFIRPDGPQYGHAYADNSHRFFSIADGIYHVDGLIRAWVTERDREKETATA